MLEPATAWAPTGDVVLLPAPPLAGPLSSPAPSLYGHPLPLCSGGLDGSLWCGFLALSAGWEKATIFEPFFFSFLEKALGRSKRLWEAMEDPGLLEGIWVLVGPRWGSIEDRVPFPSPMPSAQCVTLIELTQ